MPGSPGGAVRWRRPSHPAGWMPRARSAFRLPRVASPALPAVLPAFLSSEPMPQLVIPDGGADAGDVLASSRSIAMSLAWLRVMLESSSCRGGIRSFASRRLVAPLASGQIREAIRPCSYSLTPPVTATESAKCGCQARLATNVRLYSISGHKDPWAGLEMERETGLEPAASTLGSMSSALEPRAATTLS